MELDVGRDGATRRATRRRPTVRSRATRPPSAAGREQGLLFDDDVRRCPPTSATAARSPAPPPASPTASSTTGPAPAWSSRPSAPRHRLGHASGSTASATSSCSRSSSGCSTPASRCRTSAPRSQHLRERGVDDLAQITLMSDGASVYECTSADEVIDLVQGGQGVFGIAVGRVWREVEGTLAELPERARRRGSTDAGQPATSSPPAARPARPAEPRRRAAACASERRRSAGDVCCSCWRHPRGRVPSQPAGAPKEQSSPEPLRRQDRAGEAPLESGERDPADGDRAGRPQVGSAAYRSRTSRTPLSSGGRPRCLTCRDRDPVPRPSLDRSAAPFAARHIGPSPRRPGADARRRRPRQPRRR